MALMIRAGFRPLWSTRAFYSFPLLAWLPAPFFFSGAALFTINKVA